MRTDKETRELQAIWKFLFDLATRVAQDELQAYTGLSPAEATKNLKTRIKDTAAAYGTNIGS